MLNARTDAACRSADALEDARRDGVLELPDGDTLAVTNLHKVFWPKQKLTKGDLFRYYARVAPVHPAGGRRSAAGDEAVSQRHRGKAVLSASRAGRAGRRAHRDRAASPSSGRRSSAAALKTLLYMTQLAAISQDPWFSRVAAPGIRRPRRARSRSVRRRAVRARARRRAMDPRRARRARRDRRAEDVGRRRPARLHPAAAGHAVRGRPALLPDHRDRRRAEASEGGDDRAQRVRRAAARVYVDYLQNILARRWRPPTARAPANTPACRRR